MANGNFPSLSELLSAAQMSGQAGPGQVIQSGLEGFLTGQKMAQQRATDQARQALEQAKLKLQQQRFGAEQLASEQQQQLAAQKQALSAQAQEAGTISAEELKTKKLEGERKVTPAVAKLLEEPTDKKGTGKPPQFLFQTQLKQKQAERFITEMDLIVAKMPQSIPEAGKVKAQQLGRGFFGGDPDVLSFEQARPTMGRALYKFLSGDVGNISQSEGQFAVDLIPSAFEAPELRMAKISRLKRLKTEADAITQALAAQVEAGTLDVKDFEERVKAEVLGLMQRSTAERISTVPGVTSEQPASQPKTVDDIKAMFPGAVIEEVTE